jgi:hypothetical protein
MARKKALKYSQDKLEKPLLTRSAALRNTLEKRRLEPKGFKFKRKLRKLGE